MNNLRVHAVACAFLVLLPLLACGPDTSAAVREDQRPPEWAQTTDLPGAKNLYQVDASVYRAAQPSAQGMRSLERHGVKTIINLRNSHSDADLVRGTGLRLVELPVKTWSVSDDAYVTRVLQAIRDAEKPVLVHCKHGADRTGLTIAMYRMVEQGWTREQALAELRGGGFGYHTIWTNIPEYIETVDVDAIRSSLK